MRIVAQPTRTYETSHTCAICGHESHQTWCSRSKEPSVSLSMGAWVDRAACGDVEDPEIFFEYKGVAAKEICATCPVIAACFQYAVANGMDFGVWGSKTPSERLRAGRNRALDRRRLDRELGDSDL